MSGFSQGFFTFPVLRHHSCKKFKFGDFVTLVVRAFQCLLEGLFALAGDLLLISVIIYYFYRGLYEGAFVVSPDLFFFNYTCTCIYIIC